MSFKQRKIKQMMSKKRTKALTILTKMNTDTARSGKSEKSNASKKKLKRQPTLIPIKNMIT